MRHWMSRRSIAQLAAAIVAGAALPGHAAAQLAGAPDYAGFTATQFIPFAPDTNTSPTPFTSAVSLAFRIEPPLGAASEPSTVRATMDTGTTGVMLPWYHVPGYRLQDSAQYEQGWEFLSSSKLLWVGRWVTRDLTFLDTLGRPAATARVPVLAVVREVTCPGYVEGQGGDDGTCPSADTTTLCMKEPPPHRSFCQYHFHVPDTALAYIGVGFGREGDGQPQGTPHKNPLLNITAIAGEPVQPRAMRSGYIITPGGVHVGLTPANTAGFGFARLGPRMVPDSANAADSTASTIPRDWGAPTACISVDSAPCATGTALIDTGINQMYLTVPPSMPVTVDSVPNPSLHCDSVLGVADGSRIQVTFPGTGTPPVSYSFTVGDTTSLTAPSVVLVTRPATTFVNTGRHFYRAFNVLLDADGGYFGLRPVAPDPAWRAAPGTICRTRQRAPGGARPAAPGPAVRGDGRP